MLERYDESRRRFLTRIGTGAASALTVAYPTVQKLIAPRPIDAPPIGPINVHGSRVVLQEVDSRGVYWTPAVQELVESASVVIPEFFVDEWSLPGSELFRLANETAEFTEVWHLVADACRAKKVPTPIWSVDPYFSDQAIVFRAALASIEAPVLASAVALAIGTKFPPSPISRSETRVSRRKFGRLLGLSIAGGTVAGGTAAALNTTLQFEAEHSFRQALVAHRIHTLCRKGLIPCDSDVVVLFPRHHVASELTPNGIEECLRNNELRIRLADFWTGVVKMSGLIDLSLTRSFPTASVDSRAAISLDTVGLSLSA